MTWDSRAYSPESTSTFATKFGPVKYKNLKSMAHNHTHSFVSGMNQVDGVYIMSEIRRIFGSIEDRVITVKWLPELNCSIEPSPILRKSISYWAAHLPTHLKNHQVTPNMIQSFVTQFSITIQRGIRVNSILIDDRGREYTQNVSW